MSGIKIIVKNKRASFDFFLKEKIEAGIELKGTEVKSLRTGNANLNDAFVTIDDKMEAWLYNMNISHYAFGNLHNHEEARKRKLLLNRKEIENLKTACKLEGLSIIPTMIYFKNSYVKIEIALAKGKKLYDKREAQATKDVERKLRQGNFE